MHAINYLEAVPLFEVTRYAGVRTRPSDASHVSGTPRRHPYDPDKILFLPEPLEKPRFFYEIRLADIVFAEEINRIATADGESLEIIRLWIAHGSVCLAMQPFEVAPGTRFPSSVINE